MTSPHTPIQLNPETVEEQLRGIWTLLSPADRALLQAIVDAINGRPVRITVGNLKGGANKTTTTVFSALLLALTGDPVLVIDADPKNQGVLLWKLAAGDDWPINITVMPWATPDLARRVKAMEGQFKHLLIDTSPQHDEILEAALMVTDTLVIPCQPTPMDTAQLDETFKSADKIDMLKDMQGGGLATIVMFVRAKNAGANETNLVTRAYSDVKKADYPTASIPLYDSVKYAEAFGTFPRKFYGYGPILAELIAFALDLDKVPGRDGEGA